MAHQATETAVLGLGRLFSPEPPQSGLDQKSGLDTISDYSRAAILITLREAYW